MIRNWATEHTAIENTEHSSVDSLAQNKRIQMSLHGNEGSSINPGARACKKAKAATKGRVRKQGRPAWVSPALIKCPASGNTGHKRNSITRNWYRRKGYKG